MPESCENLMANIQDRGQKTQLWIWAALIAVVIFVSVIRIHLLDVPLERDEGEYAYGGQMLLQGFLPYEPPSLYKYKLPGIYFIYAIILYLFGQTVSAVHLGLLIANLATILLLFLLSKKLFGYFAAVAAAAFYAVISLGTSVLGPFAHAEHFVVLVAVAGILLLLIAIDSFRWWKLFLSGVLLGCAYIIRQHGMAFAVFGAVYLLWKIFRQPEHKWRYVISHFAVFCAGLILPFLLTCGVFLFAGTFDKFWFWTFTYARENLDMMEFSVGMELLAENMGHVVVSTFLIWLLAAWGLVAIFKNRQLNRQRFFMITFFVFSFLSVCPGLYFRRHYFVLLLPVAAVLAGLGAVQIKAFFLRGWRPNVTNIISACIVLLAFGHVIYHERNVFLKLSPQEVSRFIYGTNPFPESLEIASYIEGNSSPDDTVAILGSEPQILFYAKRRSPTGHTDTYEMMKSHPYAIEMQKEMIGEIEAAAPKFIIFVRSYLSWLSEPNSPNDIFDWFEQYQKKYYTQVGLVNISGPASTKYIWGRQVSEHQPASDNWIAIFERKN